MWGVDLAQFQFDWELTWAAVFLNADKTVYGRFGSRRNHDGVDGDNRVEAFRKAAEGALELHAAYPGNAKELAGKQPAKVKWRTAETLPVLRGRPNIKPANGERAMCIHCHQVQEGLLWSQRAAGEPIPDPLLWTHPDTAVLGFELDRVDRATVTGKSTAPFEKGDKILKLDGQPILSIADVQWVLDHADKKELDVEIERKGERLAVKLALPGGWRRRGDFAWRSINWSLRHRLAGTGKLDERPERPPGSGMKAAMELKVTRLPPDWVKDRNMSAAKALQAGDVIIGVDGRTDLMRECDFFAYLLQEKPPGSTVKLTIRRGANTIAATITLP
jgi:serine protease Do